MTNKLKITIGENDIKAKDIQALNILLKQLNPEISKATFEKIKDVMEHATIVTIRHKGVLIGMGTLVPMKKPTSFCGSIEDVVVEENYRGKGLGEKIMQGLIKKSKILKMKLLDLTSNPKRKRANELYVSMGFERRKTNAYRLYN
jgi:N-acetylglutamate synthase-like GNAT family acetyltransferase